MVLSLTVGSDIFLDVNMVSLHTAFHYHVLTVLIIIIAIKLAGLRSAIGRAPDS